MNKFGERLRQLREDQGIKQVDLARILNLTSQALSQYERSSRMPDSTTLMNLADYFSVTTDYLLGVSDVKTFEEYKFIQNASNLGSKLSKVNSDTRKAIVSMVDYTYLIANSHLEDAEKDENNNVLELYHDIYLLIYKFNINFKNMDRHKLAHTNFYDYTDYKNEFSIILDKLFRVYFEDSIQKYEQSLKLKKMNFLSKWIKSNSEGKPDIERLNDINKIYISSDEINSNSFISEVDENDDDCIDKDGKFEEAFSHILAEKLSTLLEDTSDDEKLKLLGVISQCL